MLKGYVWGYEVGVLNEGVKLCLYYLVINWGSLISLCCGDSGFEIIDFYDVRDEFWLVFNCDDSVYWGEDD